MKRLSSGVAHNLGWGRWPVLTKKNDRLRSAVVLPMSLALGTLPEFCRKVPVGTIFLAKTRGKSYNWRGKVPPTWEFGFPVETPLLADTLPYVTS